MMAAEHGDETKAKRSKNWPIVLLLIVQLLSGFVLIPQGSFFSIYLEEQLGYTTILISAFATMGQLLGVVASAVGGVLSDVLGLPFFVAAVLNLGAIVIAVSFFRLVALQEHHTV